MSRVHTGRNDLLRPWALYVFVFGAFVFLTLPRMAQKGMFLDGVTYAAIARNLADGSGTFWKPAYTATLYPTFHEQPPLGLALQAAAFWLFGDHLFVERLYACFVGLLTGLLIVRIWAETSTEPSYGWLPLVFWLLPSTVTWVMVNNMLENTQALLTTASVLGFIRALRGRTFTWGLLAAFCVTGAVLVKGPVGLFPLLAPVVAAIQLRESRARAISVGITMIAGMGFCALVVFAQADARDAFRSYWEQQLGASISGARGGERWSALLHHLSGGVLMRMGGLVAVSYLLALAARRRPTFERTDVARQWGWFFVLLGLAASLPVAFSTKIVGHYFVPSAAMLACGCAMLSLPAVRPLLQASRTRNVPTLMVGIAGAALVVVSIALALSGRTYEPRDSAWMAEYDQVSGAAPRGAIVATCEAAQTDWSLHAYFQRFFRISLDTRAAVNHQYFLELRDRPCDVPPQCRAVTGSTRMIIRECGRGES